MGDPRRPDRIEIPLTSSDGTDGWMPSRSDGRPADLDPARWQPSDFATDGGGSHPDEVQVATGTTSTPDGPEHWRVAVTVVVAVVALALGWLLGRSGASDDGAGGRPEPTVAVMSPPTSTSDGLAAIEPPVSAPPGVPTATAPVAAAPTTVLADPITVETVDVDPVVAGMSAQIVALASGRRLLVLDLVTSTLTSRVVSSQLFGPPTVLAGADWILLPSWTETLPSTLLRGADDPVQVDLGSAWSIAWSPGSDWLWRNDAELDQGRRGIVEQIAPDGTPSGVSIALPTAPRMVDPAGGLVVEVPGGSYQVTPQAVTEITTGRLVALGSTQVLALECDDRLVCGYVLIDRSTGIRRPLPIDPQLGEQPYFRSPEGALAGAAFSPDGSALVVRRLAGASDDLQVFGVVDLETGGFDEISTTLEQLPFAWSPDGGVLYYLEGGRLQRFDRATGGVQPVADAMFAIDAFTVRPSLPADAG